MKKLAILPAAFLLAIMLPAGTALASASPGPVPQQCPGPVAGGVPPGGVQFDAYQSSCLIQSGEFGFSIGPRVLHVGQDIEGTAVNTTGKDSWTWNCAQYQVGVSNPGSCFVKELGGPHAKPVSGCGANAPTCTVKVSADVASTTWTIYGMDASVPSFNTFAGAVSTDYFIVDNDLYELSGKVLFSTGTGKEKPAADIEVKAVGAHGTHTTTTNAQGKYLFVLHKGEFTVSLPHRVAEPSERHVSLTHNPTTGVDFKTGCLGEPSLTVIHVRANHDTTIGIEGKNWDVEGCGPVTLTAVLPTAKEQPLVKPIAVYHTNDFKQILTLHGTRICGANFVAEQPSGRRLDKGYVNGKPVPAVILLADPAIDTHGDALFPGDILCDSEVGSAAFDIDAGQITAKDVSAIAQNLGSHLLEIQSAKSGEIVMANPSGTVAVEGNSEQGFSKDAIVEKVHGLEEGVHPVDLPSTNSGSYTCPGGFCRSSGSVTINGDLVLNNSVVFINGSLNVTGTIRGIGSIWVISNVQASGVSLQTDAEDALIVGGKFEFPP